MRIRLARLILALPVMAIVALTTATVASAANGVDVTVDPNAQLTAKVEVITTVTVTCPSGWLTMGSAVSIEQAVGKSIAHGTAYIPGVQCTGESQTVPVTILADPSGPPFKKGTAIVTASLQACDYTVFRCESSTANTAVRLR